MLDLYGGAGNLSLQLASCSPEIHCVDFSVPKQAPPGTPEHFQFHRASVPDWLEASARQERYSRPAWSVILDPPRIGLAHDFQRVAPALERLGAQEILAVGCDVDAWLRDITRWERRGWKIEKLGVLDLFPQTAHVECLALLRKTVSC